MKIEELLRSMRQIRASDLFVCEGKAPAARVDGVVRPIDTPAVTPEEVDAFLALSLTPAALDEYSANGDLDVG